MNYVEFYKDAIEVNGNRIKIGNSLLKAIVEVASDFRNNKPTNACGMYCLEQFSKKIAKLSVNDSQFLLSHLGFPNGCL